MKKVIPVLAAALVLAGCGQHDPVGAGPDSCGWQLSMIDTGSRLGPSDFDAGYNGFITPVKPGNAIIIRGKLPRARYVALAIYDQDFMLVDAVEGSELKTTGDNPFGLGVRRDGEPASFEVVVLMEPKPTVRTMPNFLYAGSTLRGKDNHWAVITWRVYLPDRGLGWRDRNPLAAFGGVEPPTVEFLDADSKHSACPTRAETRAGRNRIISAALSANLGKITRPDMAGKPLSPPAWLNNASAADQDESTYVPNPYAAYIVTAVSNDHGPLLVLRWTPARTPTETFDGAPFPADYDLRYWSLSFVEYQPGKNFGYITEKSIADIDLPKLPDGTTQLVIGFDGISRPDFVPPEQWVGLKMKTGMFLVRNIMARPGYGGDFFALPAGPIDAAHDQYTPGGIYCTIEQLRADRDLGLRRAEPRRGDAR